MNKKYVTKANNSVLQDFSQDQQEKPLQKVLVLQN
jgi:hypothetical protein